jgi:hypothetical protein
LNVTVPVGAVFPEVGETVAVKVTPDPALACADETVSVVVVVIVFDWKLAVTDSAAVMEVEHAPLPEQAPVHPAKVDPAAGFSVNVTEVPLAKFAMHVPGQLIPAGLLVTAPLPDPETFTVSANVVPALDAFR